jgi:hypothetical protein
MSSACDEEEEMIQDLLPTFVSARQVWSRLLSPTDHKNFAGCHDEHSFADWWCKTIRRVKDYKGVFGMGLLHLKAALLQNSRME